MTQPDTLQPSLIATLPEWPLFGFVDDLRPALRAALASGKSAVLATIAGLGGGGPRPIGAQMVFGEGVTAGFLSGGCIEADVALHAQATFDDGQARRLIYGEGSPWPDIRLLCGVRMEVLVERIGPDDAATAELLALMDQRRPAVWLSDGERRACGSLDAPPRSWQGALRLVHDPVWRLAVVGSDPTALAIASLGTQAGFDTTLIRPKGPLTPPPLPGVAYSRRSVGDALRAVGLDAWTAVAIATHETETDHEALIAALPSPAPYVGLLGARRRITERVDRLTACGVTDAQLARMKAPIGLDLGGKSPWEIAVAVIGEVVAQRHIGAVSRNLEEA
jgi:xanthine dehydrogenase accessory factor